MKKIRERKDKVSAIAAANHESIIESNPEVIASDKGGRPTKYEPETVSRLVMALADGLTQKQACIASGICENTLSNWRNEHPELEERLTQAREQARQKALAGIRAAGESAKGDWRALAEFLRSSFQADYRRDTNVNVNASSTVQQPLICDEATRKKLIELREQLRNSDKTVIIRDEGRLAGEREQRQRLLGDEKPVPGRTVDVVTADSHETQSSATVAQDQSPTTQKDPTYQRWEAIGRADSWKTGKGSEPVA